MTNDDAPSPTTGEDFRVLLIDDNPEDARRFEASLRENEGGVHLRWEKSLSAGLTALDDDPPHVLVVDLGRPACEEDSSTVEQCVDATEAPVVVLVDRADEERARAALEAGASEYLPKDDLSPRLVSRTLRWAVERAQMEATLTQMEATLSHQDAWIRSITENISSGIYRSTPEDGLVYVNEAFAHMFGFESPEEALKANPKTMYAHPEERERLLQIQDEKGGINGVEVEYRRKDGSTFVGLASSTSVYDASDEVRYYDGVITDITERKQTEEELRKSRERWQQLVENQRDAIHITVDGVVRYTNSAGAELVGANSREEIIGRNLREFMAEEETEAAIAERVAKIEEGEATEPYEHELERLDGERRIVESYAVPIEYEGEPAAQGIIRDLTERKQTQRQLQQAQKMETVGTLAGGIAHDFNNILHSVTAYVEMVQQDMDEDDVNRALLDRSSQGLERARSLVEKLLTFSRQDRTEQSKRVDIGVIVRESIDLVEPSLPKSVTVRTDIGDGCTVQGDPGQIHQVAMNIMTNAGQAIEEHDSTEEHVLDVDVHSLDIDDDLARRHLNLEPGRYVRLSISDTGPGMDADTQERIFEPFFTTKDVSSGTGLGLSVVHGIVQSHNGEIIVYSEPGEGTTFDVYLPYATGEGIDSHASDPEGNASTDVGRVLFVDDDEHITTLETVRLQRLGYDVTTCEDALEALQIFDAASGSFDLVLTDYAMPQLSGLELTRALRVRNYEGPIILMSGFSAQVSPEEMQAAGATTFLRKPVGSDELKQTLARVLETERHRIRSEG